MQGNLKKYLMLTPYSLQTYRAHGWSPCLWGGLTEYCCIASPCGVIHRHQDSHILKPNAIISVLQDLRIHTSKLKATFQCFSIGSKEQDMHMMVNWSAWKRIYCFPITAVLICTSLSLLSKKRFVKHTHVSRDIINAFL